VTGDADEQQVLLSVETYVNALEFLAHSLDELFRLTKENRCNDQRRALEVRDIDVYGIAESLPLSTVSEKVPRTPVNNFIETYADFGLSLVENCCSDQRRALEV